MKKWQKWLLAAALVLLAAIAGLFEGERSYEKYYRENFAAPYKAAENTMDPAGTLILYEQADGGLLIEWPEGTNAQRYVVELLRPGQPEAQVLYQAVVTEGCQCVLPQFPREETLTLRVRSQAAYKQPDRELWRNGEADLSVTGVFTPPEIHNLSWEADPERDEVSFSFGMDDNTTCTISCQGDDGQPCVLQTLEQGQALVKFGDSSPLPIPDYGRSRALTFQACSRYPGRVHYGLPSSLTVSREDLLGRVLNLQCQDMGNNVFRFSWEETKGERYLLQQLGSDGTTWQTIYEIPASGQRSYTTGHLIRYSDFTFRVIALGGQTLPGEEYAAPPEQASVHTGASVVYSTIWPQKNLDIYADSACSEIIGTAPACKAYCVLDLVDGMFCIRTGDGTSGYIDSNYCMINLPEMIGNLCVYHITNSSESAYTAHGYELPKITGTVIKGYENVEYAEGKYLVPLLYPTALKLEDAALEAIDQGYKLLIYDSFRPQKATRYLYDTAKGLEHSAIPETTFSGEPMEEMPALSPGQALTYGELMTDFGRYSMNYFLAAGGSRHNQGVALDLTLIKLSSGKEMKMQSPMHDLSWYAELPRNNGYANTLSSIMRGAGFSGLVSEWWHFQDDSAEKELELEYTYDGVSARCWMKDDTGWRYRRSDGSYYKNRTVTIDGMEYSFDENGYVIQAQ